MQEPIRRNSDPPDILKSSNSTETSAGPAASPTENLTLLDDTFRRIGEVTKNWPTLGIIFAAAVSGATRNKDKANFSWWPAVVIVLLGALSIVGYCFVGAAYAQLKRLLTTPAVVSQSPPPPKLPATASGDGWWLLFDSRTTGPFSREDLVTAAIRGDFSWDWLVCRVGTQEWIPLRSFESGSSTSPPHFSNS